MALPVDYYSTESRLAAGHWVKVRIDTTGVYAISYRQLEEWGFDNPGQVGVFGSGAVAAADHIFSINYSDDLAPTAVARQQDRLLFYGEADVRAVPLSPTSISVMRYKRESLNGGHIRGLCPPFCHGCESVISGYHASDSLSRNPQ